MGSELMPKYQAIFFEEEEGKSSVEDFVNSLDSKMSAKIYRLIGMVAANGPALREPYSKHLDDGIFELRAQSGSDISRVLFFFYVGRRVIITNGFIKKTQKTPQNEINKAKSIRKEYFLREEQKKNENL